MAGTGAKILVPGTPLGLWMRNHLVPLLLPPLLVATERSRGLRKRQSLIQDYGNVLPAS